MSHRGQMDERKQEAVVERSTFEITGSGGLRLVASRWGDQEAPAVLFLHGGGQTRHSWNATAAALAGRGWQAVAVDARGHGESDWSPVGDYRLTAFADDLALMIDHIGGTPVVVGASLGGLTAMLHSGELHTGTTAGVVLVDIIPEMDSGGAERIRKFMVEHTSQGFESLDEAAEFVAAYNPNRDRPVDPNGLRKNLRERDGRFYWHWDPAFILGDSPNPPVEITDTARLNAAVGRLVDDVPVMLVRGGVSDLVREDLATAFCERFPRVHYVDVTGAGHMVAGDKNDAFTSAVVSFTDDFR